MLELLQNPFFYLIAVLLSIIIWVSYNHAVDKGVEKERKHLQELSKTRTSEASEEKERLKKTESELSESLKRSREAEKEYIAKSKSFEKQVVKLKEKEQSLRESVKLFSLHKKALKEQEAALERERKNLDSKIHSGIIQAIANCDKTPIHAILRSKVFSSINTYDFVENPRLYSAYSEHFPLSGLNIAARMTGTSGNTYTVSLDSCTCEDYQRTHSPCKHMYRLAILVGLPQALSSVDSASVIDSFNQHHEQYVSERESFLRMKSRAAELDSEIKEFDSNLKKLSSTALTKEPWLAVQLSDLEYYYDNRTSRILSKKRPPAIKAAQEVSRIGKEKRKLLAENKAYAYRLSYYENLFPWLSEVNEAEDAKSIYQYFSHGIAEPSDDPAHSWLSVAEFEKLSTTERNQLALDRWRHRHKSDWEIGISFERYVGYTYEKEGCHVEYNGALQGLSDFGRDLIVTQPDGHVIVIQCKRWSARKLIHEKHIFQLYGSLVSYQIDHPGQSANALLISTCGLSDDAIRFADHLGISYQHNFKSEDLDSYPLIKCNIKKDGGIESRIYHLPFDQQYDRVRIDYSGGEFYAHTIQEAEAAGFRRAYRWRSANN